MQVIARAGSGLLRRLVFTVSVMSAPSPYLQTRPGKDTQQSQVCLDGRENARRSGYPCLEMGS